jgi:alpha-galactosidase
MLPAITRNVQAQTAPALKPPMGWNSWNHFAAKVTDADVRSAADALVSTGMRDAGYVYVNVDDTWEGERDAAGVLHTNSRFPDMKGLGDYIHSKGLKFGIYSSPGPKTCGGYEGSLGHEEQDAKMYASWGVDFLKYDLCSMQAMMRDERAAHPDDPDAGNKLMIAAFKKMGDALKATGRPILYSLCQYGVDEPWKWGPSVGASMWRITDDIKDRYDRMMLIGNANAPLARYAGPGHWNDPDMLEVGNGGMKLEEYRTHMTLWVMQAAPLLAGNDLSRMTPADRSVLMNADAIAIDQDALGRQATLLSQQGDFGFWRRELSGGRVALAVVNAGGRRDIAFNLRDAGVKGDPVLHDLWTGKDAQPHGGRVTLDVPTHSSMLFVLAKP